MKAILSLNDREIRDAEIADLSKSGMRVHVGERIARGTSVEIEYEGLTAHGIVWHSKRFRDVYSIGIEFQTISGARNN